MSASRPHISHYLDIGGGFAALLCAAHCAIFPMLAALAPILGHTLIEGAEPIEDLLLCTAFVLGSVSLFLGYRKHGSRQALLLLSLGLSLLLLGRFLHHDHGSVASVLLLVGGGLSVAISHFVNFRLCRSCCCKLGPESNEAPGRFASYDGASHHAH